MKYLVVETDEMFDDYEDAVDSVITEDYYDDEADFEEWVNDTYDRIEIAGDTYYPYDIVMRLGDLDYLRDSYREDRNDQDREEALYDLRRATEGERIYVQGHTIEVIDDDAENEPEDTDCEDEDVIESCRQRMEFEKTRIQELNDAEKQNEAEYLKMFQVIS